MKRDGIQTVAVLGAGTMGSLISYTRAAQGYAVRCIDQSPTALERGRAAHANLAAKEFPSSYTYPNPAYLQPDWLSGGLLSGRAATRERFIGTWRLISLEAIALK